MGTHSLPHVLLNTEGADPDDQPAVQVDVPPPSP